MIRTYQAQAYGAARFATSYLSLLIAVFEFEWTLKADTKSD